MLTGPTPLPPATRRTSSGILRIFFATSPGRAAIVLLCLLLGGFAESIGLASILPVLSVAAGDPQGGNSTLEGMIRGAFTAIGVPMELPILLLVVILGLWVKAGLSVWAMDYVAKQVAHIATGLRLDLIDRLLNVRWSYFVRQPVGRFTNAMSGEAARASEAYLSAATLVSLIVQAVIYVALAMLVSWQVALSSLAVGLIITLALNRLIRGARRAGRAQTRRTQALVQRLSDTLVGIKPLKAMAKHVRLSALFAADALALNKALRRQVVSKQAMRSLQEPLLAMFLCAGVFIAVVQVKMEIAEFFVMAALLTKIVLTINKAQQSYQLAALSESAFWGLRDTIAEAEAERELATGTKEPSLTRACVFDRVTFGYGDKVVLRDASFTIAAGRITAITGPSGAGKTTIADLVLALHRPQSGEIRIDELSLAEVDLTSWREMAGYVPQEVILFHDSVLANVTLGDTDYGRADAQAALEAAGAWDFVAQLPEGLDTIVGERGALLSGGQRQRIAVARALIHRPALLILDEATSALDPETEASICRNLRELSGRTGLTILAISHQPAWVEAADRVYQLSRNQVVILPDDSPLSAAGR
jgi:ATP-binding cassette, subfamily C, bacterial